MPQVGWGKTYRVAGAEPPPSVVALVAALERALQHDGFSPATDGSPDLVLNVLEDGAPRPFRRGSRGMFVAALNVGERTPDDPLRAGYPTLVRALANIAMTYVPGTGVWFTTLERGSYVVPQTGGVDDLAHDVVDRLAPLAAARLVIENEFHTDLDPALWAGDEHTARIAAAGRRLDAAGLLPAPFPIEDLVDAHDLRHIRRLYGIGGLSYGNLSERLDATQFWMSASGVDKGKLEIPGRDILLVSGYDAQAGAIVLSVPPAVEPRRVSVDAIEHWQIYESHPEVGAIVHVHAWVDGVVATDVNYPCGSEELAHSVSALIDAQVDPAHAIVGLRNHGVTATGSTLDEILDRIEPHLITQIPMT